MNTTKNIKSKSPLIWFGGKSIVADKIINHFPEHLNYIEVFGGAAHVISAKMPAKNEVYNDIDQNLVNFLMIAREYKEKLKEDLLSLPYSRYLYEKWKKEDMSHLSDYDRAVRFFYMNRSAIVAGNSESAKGTGWRHSIKSGANPARSYQGAVQRMDEFVERMRGVMIENLDFREVIDKYDSPNSLFYLDPPYLGREKMYAGCFSMRDHINLSEKLNKVKGKVILSYYDDPLLGDLYKGWRRETFETYKQVTSQKTVVKTEELLLFNFEKIGQITLF